MEVKSPYLEELLSLLMTIGTQNGTAGPVAMVISLLLQDTEERALKKEVDSNKWASQFYLTLKNCKKHLYLTGPNNECGCYNNKRICWLYGFCVYLTYCTILGFCVGDLGGERNSIDVQHHSCCCPCMSCQSVYSFSSSEVTKTGLSSGLLVDWLEHLDPEVTSVCPDLQHKLLFALNKVK